jgi:membrane AbrB-like protein
MSAPALFSFDNRGPVARWAAVVGLTFVFGGALSLLRLPAGLLIGAIAAAGAVSAMEGEIKVAPSFFIMTQAAIAGMIAQKIKPEILIEMAKDWPLLAFGALSVVLTSGLFGWALARRQIFPGATAIWGALPGVASAMTIMSESYGGDMRLVAFMQYLRVLLVALLASVVARIWTPDAAAALAAPDPPVNWPDFAISFCVLTACAWLGARLRLPAGPLLLPLFIGAAAQDAGLVRLELPRAFLLLNYVVLGWCVGQRFSRSILLHAVKALPATLGSILALIAVCGALSTALAAFAHVDAMTAYLAMSPGGVDAAAIIAASAKLDMPFVISLQLARVLLVILIGPPLARFLATRGIDSRADVV